MKDRKMLFKDESDNSVWGTPDEITVENFNFPELGIELPELQNTIKDITDDDILNVLSIFE